MKTIKNVLAAALVCASFIANSQTPLASGTAPAAATPEQKAAVKELLVAMNFKKMMSQTAGALAQNMPQMMEQVISASETMTVEQKAEAIKLEAKSRDGMRKSMIEVFNDPQIVQGMEDIMARFYGSNFQVDEIKAITAFYLSPAGSKMLSIQPQIMQQSMPEMMALITPRMNVFMSKMAKDIAEQAKAQVKTGVARETN